MNFLGINIKFTNRYIEDLPAEALLYSFSNFHFQLSTEEHINITAYPPPPQLPTYNFMQILMLISKNQVKAIIDSVSNLKYKLLFMFIYSAGLRVSEAVSLKKEDVNTDKMFISVSYKGKIRNTILSEKTLELFREYCQKHKPNNYVFENPAGEHLSIRQAQRIFSKALMKVGIYENVSIKSLRDSFAVHLLENGVCISYLQKFLDIQKRSAMKYLFAAKALNVSVKSPIDG
jgi:site-specific recombinase XerD